MIDRIMQKLGKDAHLKELLSGSAITLVLKLSGMMLGYVVVLYIARQFGAEGVGIYSLVLSVVTLLSLLSVLGMNFSILRYVGQFNRAGSYSNLKQLYRYANFLALPLSIIIASILYFGTPFITGMLFKNPKYNDALKIVALSLPFMALLNINIEYIRGLKLLRFSEYIRSVNRPLIHLVLLFALGSGVATSLMPIYTLAVAIIVTSLLSVAVVLSRVVKIPSDVQDNFTLKELIQTSAPMMVTSLASFTMGNISIYILEIYRSTEEVGFFSVAQKVALLVNLVLTAVNTISAPKFSELYWAEKHKTLQTLVLQSSKIIFFTSLLASVLLALLSEPILAMFGRDFASARAAFLMLIATQMVYAMSGSVGIFMNMTGNEKILRNVVVIVSLLSVLGNILIIPSYGITGAALVVMLAAILMNVALAIYARWKLGFVTYYLPFLRINQ